MQRISGWSDLVTPDGLFRYGSLALGIPPTALKAEWFNMLQEELANFILAYLPELNVDDNTQLLQAIRVFGANYSVKATTLAGYGILNAYTKTESDYRLSQKANNAITLGGYGIGDAYTKVATDTALALKQDKSTASMGVIGWHLCKATGRLEQWGVGEVGPDSTSAAIDFPTPFAEVYNCFGNKVSPNSQDQDANSAGAFHISNTQLKLFNDTNTYSAAVHWRAIGKAPGY